MFRICLIASSWIFLSINLSAAEKQKSKAPATPVEPKSLWEFKDSISAPESAYFDEESNFIYVSNVAGQPDAKDGVGWIQKLSIDGQIASSEWVKGLNAPKGMRAKSGVLWVSDIDELVSINVKSGIVLSVVPVPGAKFLNDIDIDADGAVYVSDTIGGKIYKMSEGKVDVFVEGDQFESPNGLLVKGDKLYVAAWGLTKDWSTKVPGTIYSIDLKSKAKTPVTRGPLGNLDGLEMDTNGDFLVSDWKAGKVMRVQPNGKVTVLFSGFKGSADIGFISRTRTLIVPAMGEDAVKAYDLAVDSGKI